MLRIRLTLTAICFAIITVTALARRPSNQCLQLAVTGSDGRTSHVYLLTFDFAGHTHWQQITTLPGIATDPAWSPDGRSIAFESGAVIYTVNVDTHVVQQVVEGHSPTWSPDGTHLAFWDGDSSPGFRYARADVYTIDLQSGVRERVTRNEDIPAHESMREDVGRSVNPDWHTSGLLYQNADDSLYAVAMLPDAKYGLDATGLLPHADYARDPAWSPDGTSIAFYSAYLSDIGGGIYRLSEAPDGEPELLAEIGEGGSPTWSPDGRYIAAEIRHEGRYQIGVIDVQDRHVTLKLGQEGLDLMRPAWRPASCVD